MLQGIKDLFLSVPLCPFSIEKNQHVCARILGKNIQVVPQVLSSHILIRQWSILLLMDDDLSNEDAFESDMVNVIDGARGEEGSAKSRSHTIPVSG